MNKHTTNAEITERAMLPLEAFANSRIDAIAATDAPNATMIVWLSNKPSKKRHTPVSARNATRVTAQKKERNRMSAILPRDEARESRSVSSRNCSLLLVNNRHKMGTIPAEAAAPKKCVKNEKREISKAACEPPWVTASNTRLVQRTPTVTRMATTKAKAATKYLPFPLGCRSHNQRCNMANASG